MTMSDFASLGQARRWLRERVDEGAKCPCCKQLAKVYKRTINAGMARSLISMYRAGRGDWVHIPTVLDARSREEGKLRYWGLVEEEMTARDDGGRAGYWRVTPAGVAFLSGRITVPKYALVYDGRCLGLTGDQVTISDCLKEPFDLAALMSA